MMRLPPRSTRTYTLFPARTLCRSAAVAFASGVAGAAFLDRARVVLVLRVADAHGTGAGEVVPVARVAGRHHAVEHVDATRDRFHQVLRPTDAHQVARAIAGQLRAGVFEHRVALGFGLAHGQAADRVAVEADLLQPFGRTRAQVMVHAALDDAEQRRVVAFVRTLRALGPAQRKLHRAIHHVHADRPEIDVHRRALVEDHHDFRIEHLLDAHAFLRAQEHGPAV